MLPDNRDLSRMNPNPETITDAYELEYRLRLHLLSSLTFKINNLLSDVNSYFCKQL